VCNTRHPDLSPRSRDVAQLSHHPRRTTGRAATMQWLIHRFHRGAARPLGRALQAAVWRFREAVHGSASCTLSNLKEAFLSTSFSAVQMTERDTESITDHVTDPARQAVESRVCSESVPLQERLREEIQIRNKPRHAQTSEDTRFSGRYRYYRRHHTTNKTTRLTGYIAPGPGGLRRVSDRLPSVGCRHLGNPVAHVTQGQEQDETWRSTRGHTIV